MAALLEGVEEILADEFAHLAPPGIGFVVLVIADALGQGVAAPGRPLEKEQDGEGVVEDQIHHKGGEGQGHGQYLDQGSGLVPALVEGRAGQEQGPENVEIEQKESDGGHDQGSRGGEGRIRRIRGISPGSLSHGLPGLVRGISDAFSLPTVPGQRRHRP